MTVSTIGGVIPRAAVKEVLDGLGVGDAIEAVGLSLRDDKFKTDGRKLERGVSDGGA